jgi:hypothetical protein
MRRSSSPKLVSMRSSNRGYLTYVNVRLRSCLSCRRKACKKIPSLGSSTVPSRSMHAHHCPRSPLLLPSQLASKLRLPSSFGGWEEEKAIASHGVGLALLPPYHSVSCPRSFAVCFPIHVSSPCVRLYPPPLVFAARGPHVRAVYLWRIR